MYTLSIQVSSRPASVTWTYFYMAYVLLNISLPLCSSKTLRILLFVIFMFMLKLFVYGKKNTKFITGLCTTHAC